MQNPDSSAQTPRADGAASDGHDMVTSYTGMNTSNHATGVTLDQSTPDREGRGGYRSSHGEDRDGCMDRPNNSGVTGVEETKGYDAKDTVKSSVDFERVKDEDTRNESQPGEVRPVEKEVRDIVDSFGAMKMSLHENPRCRPSGLGRVLRCLEQTPVTSSSRI